MIICQGTSKDYCHFHSYFHNSIDTDKMFSTSIPLTKKNLRCYPRGRQARLSTNQSTRPLKGFSFRWQSARFWSLGGNTLNIRPRFFKRPGAFLFFVFLRRSSFGRCSHHLNRCTTRWPLRTVPLDREVVDDYAKKSRF